MARLSQEEREDFLGKPQIAHLVTLRPEGTPHVAPVWFLWDDGKAWVMADGGAIKVRNIKQNPAVAVSIATPERPLSYVVLRPGDGNVEELGPGHWADVRAIRGPRPGRRVC